MYFIVVSFCWLSAAQPVHWIAYPIVVRESGNRQQSLNSLKKFCSHFLFQFLEPSRKETALRLLPSQGKRLLIGGTSLRKPPQPATQVRTGGVREGIIGEFLARQKVLDEAKPSLRTFMHGDGNGTVEFHDRG